MADARPQDDKEVPPSPGLADRLRAIEPWIQQELWAHHPEESAPRHFLRSLAQLVALTIRGVQNDQILLRASALTYVTALSVIPMLGVVIAIVGAVGADESLVEFAIDQLTTVYPRCGDVPAYSRC